VKSLEGDHEGALRTLETLWPVINAVAKYHPLYFYFYHNELAFELAELGRIEEAKETLSVALASPFAAAYPEWSKTRDELEARRTTATRSIVPVAAISTLTRALPFRIAGSGRPTRSIRSDPKSAAVHFASATRLTRPVDLQHLGGCPRLDAIVSNLSSGFIRERLAASIQSRAPPTSR
jgi:hypothetical protein